MLAGIQIFNLAGSLEIDYATRLGLFIGAVQTDAVHGNSTWGESLPPRDFLSMRCIRQHSLAARQRFGMLRASGSSVVWGSG